jgi:hypothetical protein
MIRQVRAPGRLRNNQTRERSMSRSKFVLPPHGVPLAVRRRGRLWPVAAEPVRWFSRWNWWESKLPAGPGQGNIVEIEFWRLKVQATSTSPLRTLEVRNHPGWDGWHRCCT